MSDQSKKINDTNAEEKVSGNSLPKEEETPVASLHMDAPFGSFTLAVLDTFILKESSDVVVVGRLNGKALREDAVYVTNLGNDDEAIAFTNLAGIEVDRQQVPFAENTLCAVKVRNGYTMGLRPGSVIFTRDQGPDLVRRAYLSALGEYYIQKKEMRLSRQDRDELTLTDCVELFRIYSIYLDQIAANMTDKEKEESGKTLALLKSLMADKLLSSSSVYTVVNRKTDEPHMFSVTLPVKGEEGNYYCAPPDVRLISKSYVKIFGPLYDPDVYEIRQIANDEVGINRIREFLGQVFYLNGAEAITLIYDNVGLTKEDLEDKLQFADFSKGKDQEEGTENGGDVSKPVSNPDLERWLLLMGQTDPQASDQAALSYRLYYRFMTRELQKAKFLIPIPGGVDEIRIKGGAGHSLKQEASINLPVIPGKGERPATVLFTDWRRLRIEFTEEDALVRTLDEILDSMDCVININKKIGAGIYLSKESYESLKEMK